MSLTTYLQTENGRLAYRLTLGQGPTIVFLGGFKSDMEGTKAIFLEGWAKAEGRAFLRFDYSGHGSSDGAFTDGCIGDWLGDARSALGLIDGPVVLVGSSMGGWIALLVARAMPDRIAGLVTIAAAPDFTEDSMWTGFDAEQKAALERDGKVALPSDYGDPYIITQRLITDGRDHLLLRTRLPLPFPTRFLQGTADADVSQTTAHRLLDLVTGSDVRLTLVKGADHRFSDPACLDLIVASVTEVLDRTD
jgi:pimeloyl-ACP methyl ester carboxylesterase